MKRRRPRIDKLETGILVVTILCLLSTARVLFGPAGFKAPLGPTSIDQYVKRFDELRHVLPRRGRVGYLDDPEHDQYALPNYYAAQYALAPLVVEKSLQPPSVVGNFTSSLNPYTAGEPDDLVPERDFGNGVVLFVKRRK